jgi:hypothetical protein
MKIDIGNNYVVNLFANKYIKTDILQGIGFEPHALQFNEKQLNH